jgi:hypothetical protein
MPRRRLVLVLLLCGIAVACAISWTVVNSPRATGRVVNGEVIYCGEQKSETESNWCMIRLDAGMETTVVDMPRTLPGQKLVLIEMRTPVTKRTQYFIQHYGKL